MNLVALILEGDEQAVAHMLIERCGSGLKYLAQSKYQAMGLQFEDAVSELFLHLQRNDWKALRDFRGQGEGGRSCKLTHYIYFIASRLFWRKMGRTVKEISWSVPLDEMEGQLPADDRTQRRIETVDMMDAVMALKNPEDRAVILLYKIEGKSVKEVAQILNTTPRNIYTRCSRALDELRDRLKTGGAHV